MPIDIVYICDKCIENVPLYNRFGTLDQTICIFQKLEQEKYALQLRLDHKTSMENNYAEEIDSLKSALCQRDERLGTFETEQNSRVTEVKKQVMTRRLFTVHLNCLLFQNIMLNFYMTLLAYMVS